MELTLAQALRQGVTAHEEGKLQDAKRFYCSILLTEPNPPDANHNLGVLAVAVGKLQDAVALFELALEVNSRIEQFWLGYIDALLKANRLEDVKQALADGGASGISSENCPCFISNFRKYSR